MLYFILASYIAIEWRKLYPLGHNLLYIDHDNIPICLAITWYQFLFLPVKFIYSIDSTLLDSAFFSPKLFLFSISHIFDNIIESMRRKASQLNATSEAIHQRILLYGKVFKPTLLLLLKPTLQFLLDTLNSNL